MGELFEFKNGLSKGKEFFGRGTPFITFSDVFNHNFLHKSDIKSLVECSEEEKQKLHVGRGDVLFTRTSETAEDVGHSSVMLDDIGDCVFNGFTIRATPKTKELLPEYCAYCFCTDSFRNYVTKNCAFTTRASLTGSTIAEYKIPVPSLALQKRIANILGNFDKICSDLNIGLPAEIGLRKKQYEYYRDRILSFNTNVNNSIHGGGNLHDEIKLLQYVFGYAMVRLSDTIISLKTGLNPRQNFKLNIEGNNLPYITGKDIFGNKINVSDKTDRIDQKTVNLINKRACIENDDLLFASTGTGTVGRMAVVYDYANQWAVSETLYCLKPKKDLVLTKFLLFFLSCSDAKNQYEPKISKGSVPHLKVADLLNVAVALPSLNEQKRIVEILDKFDVLVNDLSQGIPAEIEARKKQYEYYRDKLLNFKSKVA